MDPTAPITIAYIGNFTRSWCTEVHVAASLEALGHRVVRWQEDQLHWPTVPAGCDEEGVHMLLWTRTWPADLDVVVPELDRLRDMGVPTVSYHLDRWWGLDREHQVQDQPFFHTDLVVSPDDSPRWAEAGVNHLWMPPGVFGPECEPVPANPRAWPAEVVFVGSYPYPHAEWADYRAGLIMAMRQAFGRRFDVLPHRRTGRAGRPIRGRELAELYATAKVVVGDSCLAGESHRYWSDRIPETLGRGGLLIHPEVNGMADWYANHAGMAPSAGTGDLLTYDLGRYEQAVVLAEWALSQPAEAREVAEHGRATVLGRDTYQHRMAELIEHVRASMGWRVPRVKVDITPTVPGTLHGDEALHPRVIARWGRQRAAFDPRPGYVDVAGGDFVVVTECWTRNDYRVPATGFRGTVIDVGANVGAFSVLAAKAGAKRVVAFEPHDENRARLEHHLELNHVANRVTVCPRAVTGDGRPVVMTGNGGGAHVDPDGSGEAVQSLTLAEVLFDHAPVEFLKIDCEGGEYEMIAALPKGYLRDYVQTMALEWHGPVMPHLSQLTGDEFGPLVTRLADEGHVELHGHPGAGGLLWWRAF